MQWIREQAPNQERRSLYRTAMIITLAGNLILVIGKGIATYLSHSTAFYADTANSASDVVYSLMIVLGLWMAQQPPDISHPQGHSRFEPLVGLAVAASMTFAGYEAARVAIVRFIEGGKSIELGAPTIILIVAVLIKIGMFISIRRIARQLGSPTFEATARDNLSDVLTSTAAFLGALGSSVVPLFDPIAGIAVSIWIFRAALTAWKENLAFLTGAGAPPELREKIAQVAGEVEGVHEVHQVITEYAGPQLIADLHINVDGHITLDQAHAICDEVQRRLEAIPEVDRAYIHVEPEEKK